MEQIWGALGIQPESPHPTQPRESAEVPINQGIESRTGEFGVREKIRSVGTPTVSETPRDETASSLRFGFMGRMESSGMILFHASLDDLDEGIEGPSVN